MCRLRGWRKQAVFKKGKEGCNPGAPGVCVHISVRCGAQVGALDEDGRVGRVRSCGTCRI